MKIMITGSTGFIGGHVLNHLDNGRNLIYAFGRGKLKSVSPNIIYNAWDIRFPLELILPEESIDVFIHIAGDTDYTRERSEILETNVYSLSNVLDVTRRYKVKHFIYISSSSVYQGISGRIIEPHKIEKESLTNNYSISKYLAEEKIIEELDHEIKLSILRPRAVYGEGDTLLLPTILKHSFLRRLLIFGNGDIQTSLTHIDNLCEAISVVIGNQKEEREILNISDNEIMTLREIYQLIGNRHGMKGMIALPIYLLTFLERINKNKFSYISDAFTHEKILDISKIQRLGYNGGRSFKSFMSR